jgi:hypothetical protein
MRPAGYYFRPLFEVFPAKFWPSVPQSEKGPKATLAAGKGGMLWPKQHLGAPKTFFCLQQLYVNGMCVLKLPQVYILGSKHRDNVPAPARWSSQSRRTSKILKFSHYSIPAPLGFFRRVMRLHGVPRLPHKVPFGHLMMAPFPGAKSSGFRGATVPHHKKYRYSPFK